MTENSSVEVIKFDRATMKHVVPQLLAFIKDWPLIEWNEDNFFKELPEKWACSFGLSVDNKICGFCIASENVVDMFYIHLLFVAPDFRSGGFGKRLVKEAQRLSEIRGLKGIMLRCPITNDRAIDFYKTNGFHVVRQVQDDVSGEIPDVVMEFSIS